MRAYRHKAWAETVMYASIFIPCRETERERVFSRAYLNVTIWRMGYVYDWARLSYKCTAEQQNLQGQGQASGCSKHMFMYPKMANSHWQMSHNREGNKKLIIRRSFLVLSSGRHISLLMKMDFHIMLLPKQNTWIFACYEQFSSSPNYWLANLW
jgi:hypothetical protein